MSTVLPQAITERVDQLREEAKALHAELKEIYELMPGVPDVAEKVLLARLNCAALMGALKLITNPARRLVRLERFQPWQDKRMLAAGDRSFEGE